MQLKSTNQEDATVICGDQGPHRSDVPSVDARPEDQVTPDPTSIHHCAPQYFVSSPEVKGERHSKNINIIFFHQCNDRSKEKLS